MKCFTIIFVVVPVYIVWASEEAKDVHTDQQLRRGVILDLVHAAMKGIAQNLIRDVDQIYQNKNQKIKVKLPHEGGYLAKEGSVPSEGAEIETGGEEATADETEINADETIDENPEETTDENSDGTTATNLEDGVTISPNAEQAED